VLQVAEGEHWLRKNWTTPVLLLGVFLVALFLRAYFPWELAFPGGLLSGGSDAFYYHRIIQVIAETGQHLTSDPLLNFPMGLENPRPPLFAWTTAVMGKLLSPFFASPMQAVTFAFLGSTALWGALTVFPLYFLTKEAFGKRVALLTSFFLAILPAHLQRSPATNGDHDAMVLFFVVSGFFFFLKSLKSLNEKRWVDDWRVWKKEGRASLRQGLGVFFSENRKSLLYATLAGWCIATIALTWQGWAYAPIILLVYFLFQVLVHRLRNQDPMGVTIAFGVALGLPLLVAAPWYFGTYGQVGTWYDVPFYLFVIALAVGFVFTATRDYPWALVLPVLAVLGGVAVVSAAFVNPSIGNAFLSGAGYFVRTKAYETIAEAQPPGLSQIILSFGVATYFLALFGLFWLARGIPKHPTPDYLFVVVWAIAAIFMAQAAARFIFNAAPAFAMASAWVTVLLLDWLRFDDLRKKFRSLGGGFTGFRRSVRARHVLGSLFVLFILLLPNVWFGVDAAIPFERKVEFDRQVYGAVPDFLRPSGYDQISQSGSSFYFGAFGYSLPLEREYFPAAWSWFRDVDSDIHPVEDRPAFLSWWDYGFEAVDVGAHPTVADNFLDGYHLAGNFITAQSEEEAIALLNVRLLEGDFYKERRRSFGPEAKAVIASFGLSWPALDAAFRDPAGYVDDIVADPNRYGNYEELQPANAKYIWAGQNLMDNLDADELAAMNHALRGVVGASIRYFAVDTRLFPLSGQNTGIFYAPAKLSDHRILELRDGRTVPSDFFDVIATTQRGPVPIDEVRDTDQVTDLTLRYKDLFYNSMFYRAFVGFAPTVAGQSCDDCIPGLPAPNNQGMANILPMQGWNLSHFRVVYKTAYYNPFPREEIANHTDAWRAVEYKEAQDLQGKINRGEATGVVDATPTSLIRRGIVFLKYYDGAFLNGTVTLDGVPWPNVRVTVHDDYDIPHDTVLTGADGRYSVLLPFGQVHVAYSLGTADNRTMTGPTTVHELRLEVSDEAAMRANVDGDGDGLVDWKITRDVDVSGATRSGSLFLDVDRDRKLDAGEPLLGGADLTFRGSEVNLERSARTATDGTFRVTGLYPGPYDVTVGAQGRTLTLTNVSVAEGRSTEDLVVVPTTIQGRILDEDGRRLEGATVALTDRTNGTTFRATSAKDGFFSFPGLLGGAFDVDAEKGDNASLPSRAFVAAGVEVVFHNITVYPGSPVSVQTTLGGTRQGFVTLTLEQRSAARLVRVVTTDGDGRATVSLPRGTWDVHARHYSGTALWAFVGVSEVRVGAPTSLTVSLTPGAAVGGLLYNTENRTEAFGSAEVYFRGVSGQHRVRADLTGEYLAHLPLGTWTVQSSHLDFPLYEVRTITADARIDLTARRGVFVQGTVLREFLDPGPVPVEDPVGDAILQFFDATRTFETMTGGDGRFGIALPQTGAFALRVTRPGFVALERPAANASGWQQAASGVSIVAEDVVLSGFLRLEGALVTDRTLEVVFEAQGPGAVQALANLDGAGGYTASVQPGPYRPVVDRELAAQGDTRLQTRDDLSLFVAVDADPIAQDLALVVRHRVQGTVTLGGQPRSPTIRFEGPDVRETNATSGSYSTFLVAGAYTVTANATEGVDRYLALQRLDVSGPTIAPVSLLLATNVTGTVAFEGGLVGGVPVAFTRTEGAAVRAISDDFGQYSALLLGGSYSVAVDHAGASTLSQGPRHVRYSFDGSLSVTQGNRIALFNVDLTRSLDNTTVEGVVRFNGDPVIAQLTFVARNGNGINATASSGSDGRYTLDMQGGEYHVYAIAPLKSAVFLGTFELPTGPTRTFDLTLVPGLRLSGTTTLGGTPAAANLTFSTTGGRAYLTSDAAGRYSILLPANSYDVEVTTAGTERGIAVSYRDRSTIVLTEPDVKSLDLGKVVRREVDLTWDESERREIPPGSAVDYTLTLTNRGNEDDTFVLSAGLPGFTFSFNNDRVTIPFGSTGNARAVRVTITAAKDARVDHAPITVSAESTSDAAVAKSVSLQLDVTRYRGLSADVSTSAPTWDGRFLDYTLTVRNAGNGQETFQLTLPNEQELRAAGWRPAFVSSGETTTILNLTVAGNFTSRPVLRLEKVGGSGGATVNVQVANTQDATQADLVTVRVQLPALALEGRVRAVGPGITLLEPGIDTATAAFLVSLVAVIAAGAYLTLLRRRSR